MLLGLIGYKNSGKTSITKELEKYLDLPVKMIGFSNPLYAMLEAGFGITLEEIQDKSRREIPDSRLEGRSIQYALNTLGTNWGRKLINEDVWLNRSLRSIDRHIVNVADNIRFPNEFDGIKRFGGTTIAIVNPDVKDDGSEPEKHIKDLQFFADHTIMNNPKTNTIAEAAYYLASIIRFKS